jgi:pantothenate synthetase
MQTINRAQESEEKAVVFAGYLEGVRLIDNLLF